MAKMVFIQPSVQNATDTKCSMILNDNHSYYIHSHRHPFGTYYIPGAHFTHTPNSRIICVCECPAYTHTHTHTHVYNYTGNFQPKQKSDEKKCFILATHHVSKMKNKIACFFVYKIEAVFIYHIFGIHKHTHKKNCLQNFEYFTKFRKKRSWIMMQFYKPKIINRMNCNGQTCKESVLVSRSILSSKKKINKNTTTKYTS